MGSFDGVNICELVGLHLLDKLLNLIGRENVRLYRGDGLAVVNSSSGNALEKKIRKNIIALFKNERLSMTIENNLFETAFFEVTSNLVTGKFSPFSKPNNQPATLYQSEI